MTTIAEYRGSRELFANLALRELRSKYKRSFLGWTWSMINPLANTLVYTVVFAYFLRAQPPLGKPSGIKVYALMLLCGLLPWNFFQNSVMGSVGSLVGNGNLIRKTYFPRELLPASAVGANLVSHLVEMGVLMIVFLAFGDYYALLNLPFVLLLIFITGIFGLGMGLLCSILNVYFRDIEYFLTIFFLIWLYATPIVYPVSVVADKHVFGMNLLTLMKINPMTDMTLLFHATLYNGTLPGWYELAYFTGFALALLLIGLTVFNRLEGRLAEEL